MGFCYPGQDANGGDLPPRRECAPRWRQRLFEQLPQIELMLRVGGYAQRWHLKERARAGVTATVEDWRAIWKAPIARATCRCRIRRGATTLGSRHVRGSRKNSFRACGPRFGPSSPEEMIFLHPP